MTRSASKERTTKETSISVRIDLDGPTGDVEASTGLPFFDHMLSQIGKHGGMDLTVKATGDLEVDSHHPVEDVAISLGEAFREALGDRFDGIAIRVPIPVGSISDVVFVTSRPTTPEEINEGYRVSIQRLTKTGWVQFYSVTAAGDGSFRKRLNDKGGRYRAVTLGTDRCAYAESEIRRHTH